MFPNTELPDFLFHGVAMSRKAPTQRELEHENRELRMEVNALRRRLKQSVRQVQNYDNYIDQREVAREMEEMPVRRRPRDPELDERKEPEFMEFTLPNGDIRRIRRISA